MPSSTLISSCWLLVMTKPSANEKRRIAALMPPISRTEENVRRAQESLMREIQLIMDEK